MSVLRSWALVLGLAEAEAVEGDIILFRPFGPSPLISSYANVCSIFISILETLFSVVKYTDFDIATIPQPTV